MRDQRETSRSSGAPGRGRVILWAWRDLVGSSRQGKVRQRAISADGTRGLGLEMEAVALLVPHEAASPGKSRDPLQMQRHKQPDWEGVRNQAGRE